jgi:hypothetical protein
LPVAEEDPEHVGAPVEADRQVRRAIAVEVARGHLPDRLGEHQGRPCSLGEATRAIAEQKANHGSRSVESRRAIRQDDVQVVVAVEIRRQPGARDAVERERLLADVEAAASIAGEQGQGSARSRSRDEIGVSVAREVSCDDRRGVADRGSDRRTGSKGPVTAPEQGGDHAGGLGAADEAQRRQVGPPVLVEVAGDRRLDPAA